MIKIGKFAALPFQICKGSVNERLQLAKKYNEKFFESICDSFNGKAIDKDVFVKKLKDIHKDKINFDIKDSTPLRCDGYIQPMVKDNVVSRYDIYIPINCEDKKVFLSNADTFMHETFHYFCKTLNPKYLKNDITMFENHLSARSKNFYNKQLYTKYGYDTDMLKNYFLPVYMRQFSQKEQITILNSWRYRLTEELNAYKEGTKYFQKIKETLKEERCCDNGSEFEFEEKIKIIEDALRETLTTARISLKQVDKPRF